MHLRISCAPLVCGAILASIAQTSPAEAESHATDVMPAPAVVRVFAGRIEISGDLVIRLLSKSDSRLDAAIERTTSRWSLRFDPSLNRSRPTPLTLRIKCDGPGAAVPTLSEDESYTLDMSDDGISLRASTTVGVMRGLETLLQLPKRGGSAWFLPVVSITDHPRFPWRGLLIDVSRHWEPIEVIERNLDAMALVKLNVLHLHLTDDQGFRIESLTHPELQMKGSDGQYFTQAQMREIISYAAARAIRVVPEFDIPGHSTSWVVSHPELASMPASYAIERNWGVRNPVLDPTNEGTYTLLADFLGEMSELFPDTFIHIGGDENNGVQWNASAKIQTFIREHGLQNDEGLHTYFNKRVLAIVAGHGKRLVGWDEILQTGLPPSCVIDSWRGADFIGSAAVRGYDGILSNGFYIDLLHPASEHYLVDPIPASSTLTVSQRAHVLGGEATMWGELVGPETIDSRIWPRTAAIAERLWSPQTVRDVPDMYRRLALLGNRLDEVGIRLGRERDVMLRHLVGDDLNAPGVSELRTFIDLIEPVKDFQRWRLQPGLNQRVPLVAIADAAAPESELSREFAVKVDSMLFGTSEIDRTLVSPTAALLRAWSSDAAMVAERLVSVHPALLEGTPTAHELLDACNVGGDALRALGSGIPISSESLIKSLTSLDRDAALNESATELPILPPIRLLVSAAANQGERMTLSQEQWRALIASTARQPAPGVAR
jgi:hexosaminidase